MEFIERAQHSRPVALRAFALAIAFYVVAAAALMQEAFKPLALDAVNRANACLAACQSVHPGTPKLREVGRAEPPFSEEG